MKIVKYGLSKDVLDIINEVLQTATESIPDDVIPLPGTDEYHDLENRFKVEDTISVQEGPDWDWEWEQVLWKGHLDGKPAIWSIYQEPMDRYEEIYIFPDEETLSNVWTTLKESVEKALINADE